MNYTIVSLRDMLQAIDHPNKYMSHDMAA